MFIKKSVYTLLFGSLLIYITGCTPKELPVSEGGYYQSGIYFGDSFSKGYKRGIRDGCTTAQGDYRKSHRLFKNDADYNDGWFLGRNRCRKLLVIEKEDTNTTIFE